MSFFSRVTSRLCGAAFSIMLTGAGITQAAAQSASNTALPKEDCTKSFTQRGYEKKDGLLTTYLPPEEPAFQQSPSFKSTKALLELTPDQIGQEFIVTTYIERGDARSVGDYVAQKVIKFVPSGNKNVSIVEINSSYTVPQNDPLRRTGDLNSKPQPLARLSVYSCKQGKNLYIQIKDNSFSFLHQRILSRIVRFNKREASLRTNAVVSEIRPFSDNVNFTIDYANARIRHLLIRRSPPSFTPRRADKRIGYHTVSHRNLTDWNLTNHTEYIQRWHLEKKDPQAVLSEPVKPIKFWIENSTPCILREPIKKGVLAWNTAFEVAGFKNAIEVEIQPDDADWDAGELSANVIRWELSPTGGGILGYAPVIYDPFTGEILGADINLSFTTIAATLYQWGMLATSPNTAPKPLTASLNASAPAHDDAATAQPSTAFSAPTRRAHISANASDLAPYLVNSADLGPLYNFASLLQDIRATNAQKTHSPTQNAPHRGNQPTLLRTNASSETASCSDLGNQYADQMISEFITSITMHEIGHALGLRHNFRASYWRSNDEIHDRNITNGVLTASVMDYIPINIAPPGLPQGDFANTKIGPYDIWAITYGYQPPLAEPAQEAERQKALLAQASKPEMAYADPGHTGSDPRVNTFDLTRDPLTYSVQRLNILNKTLTAASKIDTQTSSHKYRDLYTTALSEVTLLTAVIANQMAPYQFSSPTDHPDASNNPAPFLATPTKQQKETLRILGEHIFKQNALAIPAPLQQKLAINSNWLGLMQDGTVYAKLIVISSLMDPSILLKMQAANAYKDDYPASQMLLDFKQVIFGSDLGPIGHPSLSRRQQQILFVQYLDRLMRPPARNQQGHLRVPFTSNTARIATIARPVYDALLFELKLDYPWQSRDVRAHRRQLRQMLQEMR